MTVTEPLTFSEVDLIASICRESFSDFVQLFWEEVPGAGKLIWNWHMQVMCDAMQEIAERVFNEEHKLHDLVINISPGTSKSTVCSILFHPWTWTRMPTARHIHSSHTETLVLDLANKARQVIKGEKYQACFPEIELRDDQDTKGYYSNTLGGDRLSCTVGGKSPMGFHAHFLGMDDPIDPQKSVSEAELKTAADFVSNVLPTRKVNKEVSVTYLIMQRLRGGDPTDVMLRDAKKDGASHVKHICLPAEDAENVNPPELRAFYKDGLMDPIRLSKKVLREYYAKLGEYSYSGQFRQSPVPLGGSMFKNLYFNQRVKAAPFNCKRIRYWDRAALANSGCRTAGVLIAKDEDSNFYIEHVEKGQWEPYERNERMKAIALRDRAKYSPFDPIIYTEREGGSGGIDAWKGVARALAGFRVREDHVTGKGSKERRAEPWSCQLAAKNVYVVDDGSWDVEDYISEHVLFPMGVFKDQVDASSGSFNLLVGSRRAEGQMRILRSNGERKNKPMQIVVCNHDDLADFLIEEKSILIALNDPEPVGSNQPPPHGLMHNLDALTVQFADLNPADYQEVWEEPILPYDKLPEEIKFLPDIGKRIWGFLLKKRDPLHQVLVITEEEGENRALSIAYAIMDILHLPRNSCLYHLSSPDNKGEGEAPNPYVYKTMKSARAMVI